MGILNAKYTLDKNRLIVRVASIDVLVQALVPLYQKNFENDSCINHIILKWGPIWSTPNVRHHANSALLTTNGERRIHNCQ